MSKSVDINRRSTKLKNQLEERSRPETNEETIDRTSEESGTGLEKELDSNQTFRSTWARKMQAELERAANSSRKDTEEKIGEKDKTSRNVNCGKEVQKENEIRTHEKKDNEN